MYEGSLCVCCMSTDDLLGLFEVRKVNNFEENYAKILNSCLNVQLSPQDGHDSICAVCVASLKECVTFKKQILRSISVILSIDLSQIISEEDVAVLGLLQSEKDIITKSQINVNQEIINNNCDGFHSKKCEAPSPPSSPKTTNKHKRPVGRPRTHPKDNIPYEINREERNCRECGVQFLNYFSLKKHYNTHFRNHICTVCKKGFMTRISLMKHQKTHQKGPFSCDICHTQFRTLNSVQSHKHFKHTARSRRLPPNEPLPCPYCDRVFTWSGDRNRHIQNQHEIRMYPCPNCGIKLKKTSLRSHLFQRHNIGTGYKCAVCDAMRVTRAALARHMDSHLDIRRFSCKLCSKAFIQKVTLKYHIGCHVRRGEYHGDPNFLIVNSDNSKNFGLLSDDETAQYLDESFLSSDLDFEGDKSSKHLVVDQNNSNKNCVENSYLDKNNYGKSNCDKSDDLQIDSDLIKCVSDIDMNFSDLDV